MKRYTKRIKNFDKLATLFDFIYIVIAIVAISHFFSILVAPSRADRNITEEIKTTYEILNFTINSAQLNVLISLVVGYLVVFVPTTFQNIKRLRSKDIIEMDEWTYRTQFLYMFMSLFTFNPFSAVLRFIAGFEIKTIVTGEGFKKTIISIINSIVDLFNGATLKRYKLRREARREIINKQHDLERITRNDMILKVIRIVVTYTFITMMALFIFIPFYWMLLTALKTHVELTTSLAPRLFVPISEMQWVNFKVALVEFNYARFIFNTFIVGILSMLGTVVTTILAAFAFSRLDFKGRDFMFSILLMTMMIPGELYTITNYVTVSQLGWINTRYALVIPFMTSVFYIFFLRQSFKQIPDTLYRAAQVDGCGDFKYLSRVMIPIAKPTITTITILSAIGAWDAYIWPQLVAPAEENWLISVALRSPQFQIGEEGRPLYHLQLAAAAIVTIPLLIVFFTLKKYIMAGVGRSGTKG
jgi:ABC-type glycerol-3-phosphate transport system permease component